MKKKDFDKDGEDEDSDTVDSFVDDLDLDE
jgi:hypothetical protein